MTFVLVVAGGTVTSTASGLAVPDWPTTFGYPMFSVPTSILRGAVLIEHGHRVLASLVGVLILVTAVWAWMMEPRGWVRGLAGLALIAVVVQGLLGGLTVLRQLPPAVSSAHAALAHAVFGMTVGLALATGQRRDALWPAGGSADGRSPRAPGRLTLVAATLVYAQIVLGAVVRHTGSGLAIPDFPLAFGRILPPIWSLKVALHLAHRLGAVAVVIAVGWLAYEVYRLRAPRHLALPALWMLLLVLIQVVLGGLAVLTGRSELVTVAHVAAGALLLAAGLVLAWRSGALERAAGAPVRAYSPLTLGEGPGVRA
jgi:cytochrome c oxidase assembly protein subunit 15